MTQKAVFKGDKDKNKCKPIYDNKIFTSVCVYNFTMGLTIFTHCSSRDFYAASCKFKKFFFIKSDRGLNSQQFGSFLINI